MSTNVREACMHAMHWAYQKGVPAGLLASTPSSNSKQPILTSKGRGIYCVDTFYVALLAAASADSLLRPVIRPALAYI